LHSVMPAIEPGWEALLAGAAVVISARASPARPPFSRFLFPVEQRTTVPPPRTHTHRCTGSVELFRRVGLVSVPKAPLFWVVRFTWCRLVIGRLGFPVLAAVARAAAAELAGKPTPTHARAFTNPRRAAHPRAHAHAHLSARFFTELLAS
jgi:hypothetical protein